MKLLRQLGQYAIDQMICLLLLLKLNVQHCTIMLANSVHYVASLAHMIMHLLRLEVHEDAACWYN